ncbi:hypothetical protein oki361_19140 [Helicobacter pylori]|nr:Uncharacterised protein [Chlamydia abortus]
MSFVKSVLIEPKATGKDNEFLKVGLTQAQPSFPISALIVRPLITSC